MNLISPKLIIISILLFCIYPQILFGQYYPERVQKGEVKTASKEDVARFKAAPLIIIKKEIPEFKKLKTKSGKNAKERTEKRLEYRREIKKFANDFNSMADSMALMFYPFNKKIRIKSREAAERLIEKNKKKQEYAILKVYETNVGRKHHLYFDFSLSTDKKPFYRFKFPIGDNGFPILSEANYSFVFQRLENYLLRREKGSEYSMKVYKKIKKDLQSRLDSDLPSRTLLIDKNDLHEELENEDITEYYTHKFKIVDSEFIDSIILNRTPDFYYLKVIPLALNYSRNSDSVHKNHPRIDRDISLANHYIVDSIDGAAVFFKFTMDSKVDSKALETYSEQLTETNVSYR